MKVSTAQLQYLKQTLGAQSVLRTQGEPSSESEATDGAADTRVYLLVDQELTKEQRSLLEKIVGAIGESHLALLAPKAKRFAATDYFSSSQSKVLILFEDLIGETDTAAMKKGQVTQNGKLQVLLTEPLNSLLQGSEAQIQLAKRRVWAHLKSIKS